MPRFSNRPFLATTLSFLSSRGAADSLRRVGREMTKLVPSAAAKGAPGLAFETWDPSNQFPLETPILLFVIRSKASGSAVRQSCAPLLPAHNRHRILMKTPTSVVIPGFQEWSAEPQIPPRHAGTGWLRSPGFPGEIAGVVGQ